MAYGQLFAASRAEVRAFKRGELDLACWLTEAPEHCNLPASDDEDCLHMKVEGTRARC